MPPLAIPLTAPRSFYISFLTLSIITDSEFEIGSGTPPNQKTRAFAGSSLHDARCFSEAAGVSTQSFATDKATKFLSQGDGVESLRALRKRGPSEHFHGQTQLSLPTYSAHNK